jgi:TP901 family phage tail tape measure protein
MTETTTIMTRVTADTTHFRKNMSAVGRSLLAAGGKVSRLGTVMNANFKAIALSASAVGASLTAGFLKQSGELFIEFNDTLVRTQAVMQSTGEEAMTLEGTIRDIGKSTRFTASQAAQAAEVLAIAGVSFNEMVDDEVIDKLVKFAIAGGTDIQTATTIGVAGVKAFRMEMGELDAVTDVLVKTFTSANVDVVGLGEAMKFVAPVAAAAGVGIEETAAAIGALGNAGLRGTVAGTGLRMSINKLLKPTFDARKVINDLNLEVFVLSDAGKTANASLKATMNQMDVTARITSRLTMEVNNLQGELDDLAMAERKNQLSISEIRFRAAQQQRDLNESELDQIRRLEMANEELSITSQKRTIQLMETSDAMKKAEERQSSLKKRSDELIKTVEMQTMGLTSLTDLLHQMRDGNITAAQALEIFGVRGGTAVLSLMSQVDAFDELVAANKTAAGTTEQFSTTLQQSSFEALRVFKSQVEEASITLGVHFVRALFDVEYQGEKTTGVLSDFGKTLNEPGGVVEKLTPQIIELANSLKDTLPKAIDTMVATIPLFIEVLDAVVKLLPILAKLGRILTALVTPFVRLFELFMDVVNAVLTFDGSLKSLGNIVGSIVNLVLEAMVVFSGFGYVMRVLGVYFEGTNEKASKFFHFLGDLAGVGKAVFSLFRGLLKVLGKLPGLGRILTRVGAKFPRITNAVKGFKNMIDDAVKSVKDLGSAIRNNPVSRFLGKVKNALTDPRSSAEIAKSVNASNRMKLGHAMGNKAAGGTKGLSPEQINTRLRVMGVEPTPMPMFAKGGIVSKPTVGMIGEGGSSEAVVPLTNEKLKQIGVGIASASGGMGTNVTIGDIVINGDGLNKHEIQAMIERELPKIINRSMRRGAQGVI